MLVVSFILIFISSHYLGEFEESRSVQPEQKFLRNFFHSDLEDIEKEQLTLHADLAKDYTMPLISQVFVVEDQNYDCEIRGEGVIRLFEFQYSYSWDIKAPVKLLNGFPGGLTVCARFDAPSWLDSSCGTAERPHVCIQHTYQGIITNEYCAQSEKECPILSIAALEPTDLVLSQYQDSHKHSIKVEEKEMILAWTNKQSLSESDSKKAMPIVSAISSV